MTLSSFSAICVFSATSILSLYISYVFFISTLTGHIPLNKSRLPLTMSGLKGLGHPLLVLRIYSQCLRGDNRDQLQCRHRVCQWINTGWQRVDHVVIWGSSMPPWWSQRSKLLLLVVLCIMLVVSKIDYNLCSTKNIRLALRSGFSDSFQVTLDYSDK